MIKKVGLDMMIGRRSKCHYKKKQKKPIIIRANLPVGEATKSPPLGSVLGQYGLNAENFCVSFNEESVKLFQPTTRVSVRIIIDPTKKYILKFETIFVYWLLNKALVFDTYRKNYYRLPMRRRSIIATAYKIALLRSQVEDKQILQQWIRQVLHTLRSCNLLDPLRKCVKKFNYKRRNRKK